MAIQKQAAAGTQAPPQEKMVSMNPDTFTAGYMDDVDVTISDALTCEFDYNGKAPTVPALAVEMTDANGGEHVQYYKAGDLKDWAPTKDNCGFTSLSGKTGINKDTNLGKLIASLAAAGFPMEKLDGGNLKMLIGLQCHVIQETRPLTGSMMIRRGKKEGDKPDQVLIVSKINQLPDFDNPVKPKPAAATTKAAVGGKPNGQAATGTAKASAAAPAGDTVAAVDEEVAAKITELATEVVVMGEAPEGFTVGEDHVVPKKDFLKMVFATFKAAEGSTPAYCNKAVNLAGNQEFLKGLATSGVAYDGTVLRPAE
jgi:hypothetical protein